MLRAMRRRVLFCLVIPSAFFLFWMLMIKASVGKVHTAPLVIEQEIITMSGSPNSQKKAATGYGADSYRVVHFDLKGAPPKLSYLRQILPLVAAHGCNAVLLEYEDMFPYYGTLANLSARNAFSKNEVRMLLSWAHDLGLEVIPLVQTFGHLESALKLEEFKHLRELPPFPQELCPSNPDSVNLVGEIIRQVMEVHPGAKFIHIGADEVFHIAACSKCVARQLGGKELYMEHVMNVANLIHTNYPGVRPIIWDDMIRTWTPQFLAASPLASMVEPMVWAYTDDVQRLIPHYVWHWYGWSRYDHFAVLCELLPAAVPSLLLSLAAIQKPQKSINEPAIFQKWRSSIGCSPSSTFDVTAVKYNPRELTACTFPGVDFYSSVLHYLMFKKKIESLMTALAETNGWLSPYNVKHNFSSPWRLVEDYRSNRILTITNDLRAFRERTESILLRYFDKHSAQEWLEQKLDPLEEKVNKVGHSIEQLMNRETWPRRPLR